MDNLRRLLRLIAYVMAYHLSEVITVKVKIDNSDANTVKNPATLQPIPVYEAYVFILDRISLNYFRYTYNVYSYIVVKHSSKNYLIKNYSNF